MELSDEKIDGALAWRLAGYHARLESGKGLLAREWDDLDRLERHFNIPIHEKRTAPAPTGGES